VAESPRPGGLGVEGRANAHHYRRAPSTLLDRALAAATNDEAIELYAKLMAELADRVDIAIDSDDRDAENEAHAFANEVDGMFPFMASTKAAVGQASLAVDDAKRDIEVAIRNRRASETGRGWSKVESFSRRRNARVQSAWEVQRRREEKAAAKTLERADVTVERVLEAIGRLDVTGQFQPVTSRSR
jgi:hypothetical protein